MKVGEGALEKKKNLEGRDKKEDWGEVGRMGFDLSLGDGGHIDVLNNKDSNSCIWGNGLCAMFPLSSMRTQSSIGAMCWQTELVAA